MAGTYAPIGAREMTVGGVMSRGFGAIAAAPVAMLGTSFVLALPGALIGLVARGTVRPFAPGTTPFMPGTNPFAVIWPAIIGGGLVWWLLYLTAQAVLFRITLAAIDRREESFGTHLAGAARALPALFGLSIVLSLAVGFAMILLLVPGIMLAVAWSVAAPALVIERGGVFGSLGRSMRLTKGARWRVFGVCVLVFVIYYLAAGVVGVGNIAVQGLPQAGAVGTAQPIGVTILSLALQTGFIAVWSAIQAALFVELREWKDGPAGERLADIFA